MLLEQAGKITEQAVLGGFNAGAGHAQERVAGKVAGVAGDGKRAQDVVVSLNLGGYVRDELGSIEAVPFRLSILRAGADGKKQHQADNEERAHDDRNNQAHDAAVGGTWSCIRSVTEHT